MAHIALKHTGFSINMLNGSVDTGTDLATNEFNKTLIQIFNKAAAIENEPVNVMDGVIFWTSEIHHIDMAGRCHDEKGILDIFSHYISKGCTASPQNPVPYEFFFSIYG